MRRAILAALAGAVCASTPAGAHELVDGHVDYAARLVDGRLRSLIKDGELGWREPGSVVFVLGPAARVTIPPGPRSAFLGPAGDPVWTIPQVQRPGVLWAGWNTEELASTQVDGPVTWTLVAVDGPGDVAVFQTGAFGDIDVLFRSNDGLPDSRAIPLGTHAHGNWAFSREGEYQLTFTMSAGATLTDTQVLAVSVRPAATPAPTPTAPAPDPPAAAQPIELAPALRISRPRMRGRTLRVDVRLATRSQVAIALRRRGRTSARAKTRSVPAGARTLKVVLDRRPRRGPHVVRITATAGHRSVTRAARILIKK
jgi:surface-anchored protein